MSSFDMELLQAKLDELLDWDEFVAEVEAVKALDFGALPAAEAGNLFSSLIQKAATVVERVAAEAKGVLSSKEKRDAVVDFLDDVIKLPFYLELLDGPVLKIMVDMVIGALNDKLGHLWGVDAPPTENG